MEIDHRTRVYHGSHVDRWTGLLFGFLAGSTLLLVAWGVDGWALNQADGILPWVKMGLGAGLLILPMTVLGGLSIGLRRAALAGALWLLAGVLCGWVAAQIAFRLFPWALVRWAPDAARFVAYSYGLGPSGRGILASIACGLAFFVAGVVIQSLVEGWRAATYPVSRALTILLWVALFILPGAAVDGLVNRPLRAPLVAIDDLIYFRQSEPEAMGTPKARLLHASALNPAEALLARRHRLVVAGYDETVTTVRVLADFEGSWVQCTLIESEPTFCQRLD